jgi:hypothetical protein
MISDMEASQPFDLVTWLVLHPKAAITIGAFCLWVSVSLILHMWFVHRRQALIKKLLWSFVLLVPLFGWLFYGGCFQLPERTDNPCPPSSYE